MDMKNTKSTLKSGNNIAKPHIQSFRISNITSMLILFVWFKHGQGVHGSLTISLAPTDIYA